MRFDVVMFKEGIPVYKVENDQPTTTVISKKGLSVGDKITYGPEQVCAVVTVVDDDLGFATIAPFHTAILHYDKDRGIWACGATCKGRTEESQRGGRASSPP